MGRGFVLRGGHDFHASGDVELEIEEGVIANKADGGLDPGAFLRECDARGTRLNGLNLLGRTDT